MHQQLKQLFKETNYNLKKVRKTKIVKPVEIGLLPKEIKKIAVLKRKKIYLLK